MVGTVEWHGCINVNELNRARAFTEMTRSLTWACSRWPWLTKLTVDRWCVNLQFRYDQRQSIPIIWSWCHFGGWRPWFRCPFCQRRIGKLTTPDHSARVVNVAISVMRHSVEVEKAAAISKPSSFVFG